MSQAPAIQDEHAAAPPRPQSAAPTSQAAMPVEAIPAPIAAPIRVDGGHVPPADAPAGAIGAAPDSTSEALDPASVTLDDVIDATMASETLSGTTLPATTQTSADPAAEPAPDLAQAVEDLIAQPAGAASAPAAASVEHIESLDQQLAGIGDSMIEGDIVNAADALAAGDATANAGGAPATSVSVTPDSAAAPASEAARANSDAQPAAAPAVQADGAPGSAPSALHAPLPAKPGAKKHAGAKPRKQPRQSVLIPKIIGALAKPLAGKSPALQNAVAAIAIANLLMAGYVWVYVMVLRPKEPPPPPALVPTAQAAEEAAAKEGHAEAKKDEHGAAKKDAKKDTKKDAKADAKKDAKKKAPPSHH
jgi:hypothetical protein